MNNKKILKDELKDRTIEVQEDGKLLVKETVYYEYEQDYREFLTEYRNLDKMVEQINHSLSDDFKKSQEENLVKIEKEKKELERYVQESESKFMKHQEKVQRESMAEVVKNQLKLDKKERNLNYLASVWDNIKDKEDMLSLFTDEQQQELKKSKLELMKKQSR